MRQFYCVKCKTTVKEDDGKRTLTYEDGICGKCRGVKTKIKLRNTA